MNFKHVIRIASITFEESYRKKFLYILLFLSAILMVSAFLFDPFNIGQQLPVVKDICLTGLSFFGLTLTFALFLTAIPNEIEKKTLYPLLSKPVSRSDYLWGKFLGNMAMVFINLLVITLEITFLINKLIPSDINMAFRMAELKPIIWSAFLLFVECGVVGALIVLFSPFMSYPVNLVLTLLMYISGNVSQGYINFIAAEQSSSLGAMLAIVLKYILPNFEYFHIKNSVVHSYIVDPVYVSGSALYGLVYIMIVLLIADILFQRKDL
ncbi:MAG: ABC transporter permease [Firmicutes bacterium]|nr:ABC transporter permease [Bacillota bacterium]